MVIVLLDRDESIVVLPAIIVPGVVVTLTCGMRFCAVMDTRSAIVHPINNGVAGQQGTGSCDPNSSHSPRWLIHVTVAQS